MKQRTNKRYLIASMSVLLFVAGCVGNVTAPQQLSNGAMSADLNPGNFSFSSLGALASDFSGGYQIAATEDQAGAPRDVITVTVPSQATLPYTVATPDDALVEVTYNDAETNIPYYASSTTTGSSCVVTITQLTPTIQGTFTATLKAQGTSDNTRILTNGIFNAKH